MQELHRLSWEAIVLSHIWKLHEGYVTCRRKKLIVRIFSDEMYPSVVTKCHLPCIQLRLCRNVACTNTQAHTPMS